jgi:FAD dependent oxidoreductase
LGSESRGEFNEPHAPDTADRRTIQSFTYGLVVEYVPGGNFVGSKPANYEQWRDNQPFWLNSAGATPDEPAYFFKPRILKSGRRIVPFWNYRSILDTVNFQKKPGLYDRAVINVGSNDFHDESWLEHPEPESVLARARELTAAYLYWLQTEAPRDEGGFGYPELRPLPECTGTPDGIAQAPYVREGRRLRAAVTVTECDLSEACQSGARARAFRDSVGLGGYAIDIHQCAGSSAPGVWQPARPYQIPLGALVTPALRNFAVAGKGIGVSHIANGAYRLHPEEWVIGEAAAHLSAFVISRNISPLLEGRLLFDFQRLLIKSGTALYWFDDLPFDNPGFESAQLLAITGLWPGHPEHLRFEPHVSLGRCRTGFLSLMDRLAGEGLDVNGFSNTHQNSHGIRKYDVVHSIVNFLDESGWPERILIEDEKCG